MGAFQGNLPGHYRYQRRMFTHFVQEGFVPEHRGIFLAGDDISFTPGWAEGAVHTALNAVWGVVRRLGGSVGRGEPGARGPVRGGAHVNPTERGDSADVGGELPGQWVDAGMSAWLAHTNRTTLASARWMPAC